MYRPPTMQEDKNQRAEIIEIAEVYRRSTMQTEKDYTYLNDYHREQHERAKTFHLRQPKQSREEVIAQYEQQERLSGHSRSGRKAAKDTESPSTGS